MDEAGATRRDMKPRLFAHLGLDEATGQGKNISGLLVPVMIKSNHRSKAGHIQAAGRPGCPTSEVATSLSTDPALPNPERLGSIHLEVSTFSKSKLVNTLENVAPVTMIRDLDHFSSSIPLL